MPDTNDHVKAQAAPQSVIDIAKRRRANLSKAGARLLGNRPHLALSHYRGAEKNRLRDDWAGISKGSADYDLLGELSTLRARSRDLMRNDPHASGIIQRLVSNVVGTGITPQSRIRNNIGINDDTIEDYQSEIEWAFAQWAEYADVNGRMTFEEFQDLIVRQVAVNGEIFIVLRQKNRNNTPFTFCLQAVEADRVSTPNKWHPDSKNKTKDIRDGIELEDGTPVAYWIKKSHPGDSTISWVSNEWDYVRIPADRVMHLYHVKRPDQTRGEPVLAPVLGLFKDLCEYLESEMIAARISSLFTAFVIKPDVNSAFDGQAASDSESGYNVIDFEAGLVTGLEPGEDIKFAQSNRPNSNCDPFIQRILRAIGTSLGVPYEMMDFSSLSYSAARAALNEARRFFITQRAWLQKHFCQPIYNRVIDEAVLLELVRLPRYPEYRWSYQQARWIGDAWGYINPLQEAASITERLSNGTATLADVIAEQGNDWEEVLEQRAREEKRIIELRVKYGLPDNTDLKASAALDVLRATNVAE